MLESSWEEFWGPLSGPRRPVAAALARLQFSCVSHGAPVPPPLAPFSGWCCSSLQSRGKSGAHVSTSRVSPRGGVTLLQKESRYSFERRGFISVRLLGGCFFFSSLLYFRGSQTPHGDFVLPLALTLATAVLNDDRVQSANSVSNYLIISEGPVSLAS